MNQVQQYFKDFPLNKEVFETSDGLLFHQRGDANLHAQSLKDKEVKAHSAVKYATADEKAEVIENLADAAKAVVPNKAVGNPENGELLNPNASLNEAGNEGENQPPVTTNITPEPTPKKVKAAKKPKAAKEAGK